MSSIVRRALKMLSHRPDNPLVVVIGATGTGKSKVCTLNSQICLCILIAADS